MRSTYILLNHSNPNVLQFKCKYCLGRYFVQRYNTLNFIQTSHIEYSQTLIDLIYLSGFKYIYLCIWKCTQITIINQYHKTSQKTLKYVFWNLYPRYERYIKKSMYDYHQRTPTVPTLLCNILFTFSLQHSHVDGVPIYSGQRLQHIAANIVL